MITNQKINIQIDRLKIKLQTGHVMYRSIDTLHMRRPRA